jgi:hypothetical protein
MDWLFNGDVSPFIAHYGYWAVAVVIALESIGLPLPGEATLIAAMRPSVDTIISKVIGHVRATLDHFQVPAKERAEILAFVESTKRDIVEYHASAEIPAGSPG